MKKLPLHTKIIIGLILGIIYGVLASISGLSEFTNDYIKPIGTIFINLLKLIAIPLVIASLVVGISGLKDVAQLSKMGSRAILIYLMTTVIAISIGLSVVSLIKPGRYLSADKREELKENFSGLALEKTSQADQLKDSSPLQPLVDIVPSNLFESLSSNVNMLQAVFFAVFFGISLILIPQEKVSSVKSFFEGLNEVILKMVDVIMMIAPYGVFALLASLITDFAGDDIGTALELLGALGMYSLSVIVGLAIMAFIVYPLIVKFIAKQSINKFFKGIFKAQMLAFSTSSSSATLPVTMDCVEKNLEVREEVSSFVLPLGATINMDGTSLYQAVATVFIAQVSGIDLTFTQQLSVLITAVLASIGSAGVPGAGMVMLVIVLQSVGLDAALIALVAAPDRILDMTRTVVNVTGDAAVSMSVDKLTK